jgi:hypothetical protein
MSEAKRKRRMQMGDADPSGARTVSTDSTSGIPAQPIAAMPQGKGNMMNNPQVGRSMGDGAPQPGSMSGTNLYPYGDGGLSLADGRMGGVGFVQNSGQPQNLIPGRGRNRQPFNTVDQPKEGMSQEMLLPQGLAKEASTRAEKLYSAGTGDNTPSYQVGPMGMMGLPVETSIQGNVNRGQFPLQMPGQSNSSMPLTGNTTASINQSGTNTGRGGGRNQKPNAQGK